MSIELDEKNYILGFWFAQDKNDNNWLACIQRSPEGVWFGTYRFRYKKDDKIWDSEDEKSFVSFSDKKSSSEEEILEKFKLLLSVVALKFPKTEVLMIRGGIKDFIEKSKDVPWIHMKVEDVK